MNAGQLTTDDIGKTVSFPTWNALGYCRRGTLHNIRHTTPGLVTLTIGDHIHTCPTGARVDILDTTEVRGL